MFSVARGGLLCDLHGPLWSLRRILGSGPSSRAVASDAEVNEHAPRPTARRSSGHGYDSGDPPPRRRPGHLQESVVRPSLLRFGHQREAHVASVRAARQTTSIVGSGTAQPDGPNNASGLRWHGNAVCQVNRCGPRWSRTPRPPAARATRRFPWRLNRTSVSSDRGRRNRAVWPHSLCPRAVWPGAFANGALSHPGKRRR